MIGRKREGTPKASGNFYRGLAIVLLFAVAAAGAAYGLKNQTLFKKTQAPNKFHAVFLTNGQVFFGVIRREDQQTLVLDNVFYLQLVDQQLPPETEGGQPRTVQAPRLVKKSDDVYGPTGSVRINRDQVTLIEELRENSQVLQQIQTRL